MLREGLSAASWCSGSLAPLQAADMIKLVFLFLLEEGKSRMVVQWEHPC